MLLQPLVERSYLLHLAGELDAVIHLPDRQLDIAAQSLEDLLIILVGIALVQAVVEDRLSQLQLPLDQAHAQVERRLRQDRQHLLDQELILLVLAQLVVEDRDARLGVFDARVEQGGLDYRVVCHSRDPHFGGGNCRSGGCTAVPAPRQGLPPGLTFLCP